MKKVTQGTLIYGMRSSKYPGVMTYGIIISAACDLAQDKIDKVYYLTAIPIKEWLCSDKGFQLVTATPASNYRDNLLKNLEKYKLSWDVVQTLSPYEFELVAAQCISKKGDRDAALVQFEKYYRIAKGNLTFEEKAEVYLSESKAAAGFLGDILSGSNTHYIFIPNQALSEPISEDQGLIVDLLELDYFPTELVKKIADSKIDCKTMSDSEIAVYDERFFLREDPGFAYPIDGITSPWREYVLQHFSNCFVRIGVDNPGKKEAKGIVDILFQKEE